MYPTKNYLQKRGVPSLFKKTSFIVSRFRKNLIPVLTLSLIFFLTEKGNAQVDYLNLPLYNSTGYGTITNQSNITISGKRFTNNNSAVNQGGLDLYLVNCSNIIIENCFFDASYNSAIQMVSSNNITIRNSLFNNNSRGVYAVNCTGNIKTLNNQFINMSGPRIGGEYHRGQFVQYNTCTGAGNDISGNRGENFFAESYNEDMINTYASVATAASPLTISNNIFRGGGPSSSGGGIIGGDGGGRYILIENNKVVNPGAYGIACAGGQNVTIRNNQVYAERKMWHGIGYYAANYSPGSCGNTYIDNTNKSNYKNAAGVNNEYWSSGECTPCTCGGPSGGQSLASMNIPDPLITFIKEDDIWKLRSDKTYASHIFAAGDRNGGGNGAPPSRLDLSRPDANAGTDKSVTTSVTTLTSSSVASSGNALIGYRWVQVSGPNTSTIVTPALASTNVTGLITGTYVFRLELTQNNGDGYNYSTNDADWVNVVVTNGTPSPNQPPVAAAGNDMNLTLPTSFATLNGSATDPDGTIASYSWSRVSGPTVFSITNPALAITTITGLIQGTYVFRLTVTDNNGATATDDVTVTVNPLLNQLPAANAGNDITLTLPANSTTLTGSGADPDGTIASNVWSRISGPTTFTLGSPNSATTTLSNLVQGIYVFQLTVTDNSGATATDDVTVTVTAAPQPPVANAGSNITLTLPVNFTTLTGSGSDADGTITGYAWSGESGPTTFTIGTANAATTTLTNLVLGTYIFRLTVTDNSGATATGDITVTVNAAPNQAPIANAGSNIVLSLPVNSTTLTGGGTDADGTIAGYTWSKVSGPATFTLGSADAATTTLTDLVQGTYEFRLTVTDDSGATATDDVTVTVNAAPNQVPTANAGNNIVLTLPANSTTLTGSGTDVDGTIAVYAWSKVSGPATFTLGSADAATTTLTNLVQGTYTFRLTVTDNGGATATDDMTVIVNAGPVSNQAPIADAGNNIVLTLPASSTTLTGSGTDADGTIVSYAWNIVSGPATFTLGSADAATTTLTNLVQGTYEFRLTVTDNSGATATDDVTVIVNATPNQAPTANAGNNIVLTLPVNSTSLTGSGTDADGTIAGYAWSRVSGPATYTLGSANAATTTLTNLVQGTYTFRLTVTDNGGATATDDMTVIVNAAPVSNQAPIANAGNNIVLTLPTNSTTLTGSATDADGTIAGYAWSRVSGPATYTIGSANAATTTLTNLVQGTYGFRLTVTDNSGATATDDVTVTVNAAPNQVPIANAGSNIVLTLPANSTTLTGIGTDADGTIAGYAWSRVSGPVTYTLGSANAATTTLSNLVQGTYVFRLTVTDNNGATGTDNISVIVNAAPVFNQAPIANAGNNMVISLPANTITLNGSSSTDPDGTIATYVWSRVSGPTTFTFANANTAATALSNLVQGTYVFKLTVTDNSGATDSDNMTVTVNAAPNQIPAANAGNNIAITLPVNNTTLRGSGSDLDGTITGYAWSRVSGPTTFTFANVNAASTALSNLVQGTYTFRLTVTDNSGATATDDIIVTVNAAPIPNQAPIARAGNDIVLTLPANTATLNGNTSTDPDGTIVSYSWSRVSGPTTFAFTSAGSTATGLNNLVQGTYVFRLTVTDNDGATGTDNITVTVNAAPNQAPAANSGNDITLTLPVNSTTLRGSGSDPDGTIATYAWSRVSGPTAFTLTPANAATTVLSNLVQGTYVFRLTVTDNRGTVATDNVTVTVNAAVVIPNQPPVADAGADQIIALPSTSATLYGNASHDPDGTISSYRWQQLSGPGTSTFSSTATAIITLSNLEEGTYVYRLTVRDNNNAAATDTVNVTVVNNFRIYGAVALYPNPARDIVNVVLNSDSAGIVRFNIYDMQGRMVMPSVEVDKPRGFYTASINISQLRSGTYALEAITTRYKKIVTKFVKL